MRPEDTTAADWIHRPSGILGHVFDYWVMPEDPVQQVRMKVNLGFRAEHWFGSRFKTGGDNGKSWLFRTRHGFLEDRLGAYLPAAHAAGLKVLVYVNVHWFDNDFPPEMLARQADGSPVKAYGAGWLTCAAGPFRDFSVALAEDLGEYPIDGVFLDGPVGGSCWCESCRQGYRQMFGQDMPLDHLTLEDRRRMAEWSAQKVAHFVRDFRQALRKKRPDAIVYPNGSSLGLVTWQNRRSIEHADMMGIEGGFLGLSSMRRPYKTTATTKMLDCLAGGKPTVVFNDHAYKGYDYSPLPRAELDLLWAATLAGGAHPWYLLYASNFGTHAADAARYWNGFLAKHGDTLAGARPVAKVAVLWSDTTALVAAALKAEGDSVHRGLDDAMPLSSRICCNPMAAFEGAYALLARSAIPFRIVTEQELAKGLDGVEVLVAPSAPAIEEAAFQGLQKFVQAGGTLLADDEFAAVDALAQARDARELRDLLGASVAGPIPSAAPNIDFFQAGRGPLNKGLSLSPIPRPARAYRVQMSQGKPAAMFYQPMAGKYDELPPVSDMPAVVLHSPGKGHVVYMPMNLFEHYQGYGFEDCRRLVSNAITTYHNAELTVAGLHGRGEVLVRRKGSTLLVHLLNFNGGVRPFTEIMPLANVKITIGLGQAGGSKPIRARALHAGKDLSIGQTRRGFVIRLGRLGLAETVVLEMG